ncbi:uncharacterized protein CBL_07583 [Carabus blaptoides fortunei]
MAKWGEGEASANNRKGKLIFFYEWNIILKWKGTLIDGSGVSHEGKVTIPNLSEENDVTEVEITVTLKDNDEEGEIVKQVMHTMGKEKIRERLSDYISGLKQEFSKGMILPKKETMKPDNITNLSSGFNKKMNMAPVESKPKSAGGVQIETTTLKLCHKFQCRSQDFYDAMTRVEMVTAFTQGHVKLDPVKGGKFSLFQGNISGYFEDLVPGKKIVQKWRYKQWPEGHYSTVTINIDEKSDHTEVNLIQTGVPSAEADVTKANWDRYYWDAMKRAFGFGAFFT